MGWLLGAFDPLGAIVKVGGVDREGKKGLGMSAAPTSQPRFGEQYQASFEGILFSFI